MKLLIDPRALVELDDAAEFYRNESGVALAEAFVAEYERTLARALDTPAAGSLLRGRRRRFLFRPGFLTASSITSPETSCALSPSPTRAAGRTTGSGDKPP